MKICLLFPGYGSQFVGMGKKIYDEYRVVQEYFEQASQCADVNFVRLCFASSDTELSKMEHAYAAIFLVNCSFFEVLSQHNIIPDCVAGFNDGQYAGMFAGKGISFPDGLYLLSKYTSFYRELLQTVNVRVMRVTGITASNLEVMCVQIRKKLQIFVSIAIFISKKDHIISGFTDAVEMLQTLIAEKKGEFEYVDLGAGLHSHIMEPVVDNFSIYLPKVDLKNLSIPLLSNLDARYIATGAEVTDAITSGIQEPVQWYESVKKMATYDLFIEAGPGTFLINHIKNIYPEKKYIALNDSDDIKKIEKIIAENN